MSILSDDLRKTSPTFLGEEAADAIDALEEENSELKQSYELLFKENAKLRNLSDFKYAWCAICESKRKFSIRPNDDICSDICCDNCDSLLVTIYKEKNDSRG